jgi:hypothetical protein
VELYITEFAPGFVSASGKQNLILVKCLKILSWRQDDYNTSLRTSFNFTGTQISGHLPPSRSEYIVRIVRQVIKDEGRRRTDDFCTILGIWYCKYQSFFNLRFKHEADCYKVCILKAVQKVNSFFRRTSRARPKMTGNLFLTSPNGWKFSYVD